MNKRAAEIIWKWKNLLYLWKKKKNENKYVKDKKYNKIRYNCLFTGEYTGAVHSICNLKYSVTSFLIISRIVFVDRFS